MFDGDPGRSQVERGEIGNPASGMNHEIGVNRDLLALRPGVHAEAAGRALDCLAQAPIRNPLAARVSHQPFGFEDSHTVT